MLNNLAPHSRVWIFQSDKILSENEIKFIQATLNDFIPTWAAHGNELYGAFELHNELFIVIGVDEKRSSASGCSIDSLYRVIKQIGNEINVDFFNRLNTAFVDNTGKLQISNMVQFKELIKSGKINGDTFVYNNLIESKADLETKWKTSVKDSWHKNLLVVA